MKLTVYFDNSYWVGVVEEVDGGHLKAVKHIFGSEPVDGHIHEFVLKELLPLWGNAAQSVNVKQSAERRINPKRKARIVAKEMKSRGIRTESQQALQLELESRKRERKQISKAQREQLQAKKRELQRQKKKQKHRGR